MRRQFIFIPAICLLLTKGQTSSMGAVRWSVDPQLGHGALPPGTAALVPVHTLLVSNPSNRNYLLLGKKLCGRWCPRGSSRAPPCRSQAPPCRACPSITPGNPRKERTARVSAAWMPTAAFSWIPSCLLFPLLLQRHHHGRMHPAPSKHHVRPAREGEAPSPGLRLGFAVKPCLLPRLSLRMNATCA